MTPAARSILVSGIYLVLLGAGLMLAPNLVLAPFGFPPTGEVWLRVAGSETVIIGWFFLVSSGAVRLPSPSATRSAQSSELRGGAGGGGPSAPAVPTAPPPPSIPPLKGEGGDKAESFFTATLFARPFLFVTLCAYVLFSLAPPQLILFGVIDLIGAAWTFLALRRPQPPRRGEAD